jgi:hypothetical protein
MFVRPLAMLIATTSAAVALAAPQAQPTTIPDPNEKICQNISMIGSRLAKKRVCATRAEWADRRLQDRQDAEHIQRSITSSTCTPIKNNGKQVC